MRDVVLVTALKPAWHEPSSLAGLGLSLTQAAIVVDAARSAADLHSMEV
jgi:hypothetical protein